MDLHSIFASGLPEAFQFFRIVLVRLSSDCFFLFSANADQLQEEFKKQPCNLERLYGILSFSRNSIFYEYMMILFKFLDVV